MLQGSNHLKSSMELAVIWETTMQATQTQRTKHIDPNIVTSTQDLNTVTQTQISQCTNDQFPYSRNILQPNKFTKSQKIPIWNLSSLWNCYTHTFGRCCLQVICFGHPVKVTQKLSSLQQHNILKSPERSQTWSRFSCTCFPLHWLRTCWCWGSMCCFFFSGPVWQWFSSFGSVFTQKGGWQNEIVCWGICKSISQQ